MQRLPAEKLTHTHLSEDVTLPVNAGQRDIDNTAASSHLLILLIDGDDELLTRDEIFEMWKQRVSKNSIEGPVVLA